MRAPCGPCRGRGWVKRPDRDWPDVCSECAGKCVEPSLYGVAKIIGEAPSTVRRLDEGRSKGETAQRLLGKLADRWGAP